MSGSARWRNSTSWLGLALAAVVLAACNPTGPQFGAVSGKVTLNGQPLPAATVEFQPENGSPSYGISDASGGYSLAYDRDQAGALVGQHTVRVTTYDESKPRVRERLPAKYNSRSELKFEVKPGRQTIHLELSGP